MVNQWRIQDFPLGGRQPIEGGTDLRCVHFSAKTYAKMKEMDPVGGGGGGACWQRPPGSASVNGISSPTPIIMLQMALLRPKFAVFSNSL